MWIRVIIHANPLTYGVGAIRHILYLGHPGGVLEIPSFSLCITVSVLFGLAAFGATTYVAARPSK